MEVGRRAVIGDIVVAAVRGDVLAEGTGALLLPRAAEGSTKTSRLVDEVRRRFPARQAGPSDIGRIVVGSCLPWSAVGDFPVRESDGSFSVDALVTGVWDLTLAGSTNVGVPALGASDATTRALAEAVCAAAERLTTTGHMISTIALWTTDPGKFEVLNAVLREQARIRPPDNYELALAASRWWLLFADAPEATHHVASTSALPGRPFVLYKGSEPEDEDWDAERLWAVGLDARAERIANASPGAPHVDLRATYNEGGLGAVLAALDLKPPQISRELIPTEPGGRALGLDFLCRLRSFLRGAHAGLVPQSGTGGQCGLYYMLAVPEPGGHRGVVYLNLGSDAYRVVGYEGEDGRDGPFHRIVRGPDSAIVIGIGSSLARSLTSSAPARNV